MDIIEATRSFVDWDKEGGWFKEWVRNCQLHAINYGWLDVPGSELRRFVEQIKHVASWIPFLWTDHDWDHVYFWGIQREKLRRMRYLQKNYGHGVHSDKYAAEIKIAEDVLTRLINDDYVSFARKKIPLEDKDLCCIVNPHKGVMGSETGFCDTCFSKFVKKRSEREEYLVKQDMDFLGKYLSKHVRTWWD